MANLEDVVQEVRLEATSTGVTELAAAADKAGKAIDNLVVAQTSAQAKQESAQRALDRTAKALDAEYKATQQLVSVQKLLERARGQELEGTAAYVAVQAALTQKLANTASQTEKAAAAADKLAAAQRRAAAASEVMGRVNAVTGVTGGGGGGDRGADIAAYGAELDRLRAKFVPLFAIEQRHKDLLLEIAEAQKVGAISANEAAAATLKATRAYEDQTQKLERLGAAQKASAQRSVNQQLIVPDRGGDIEAYAKELDRLQAQFDPIFAAEKQFKDYVEAADFALTRGAISQEVYNKAVGNAKENLDAEVKAINGLTEAEKAALSTTERLAASQKELAERTKQAAAEAQAAADKLAAGFSRMSGQGASTLQGLDVSRGMSSASATQLDAGFAQQTRAKYDEAYRAALNYQNAVKELQRDVQAAGLGEQFLFEQTAKLTTQYTETIAKLEGIVVAEEKVVVATDKMAAGWAALSKQGMTPQTDQLANNASVRLGQMGGGASNATQYDKDRAALLPLVAAQQQAAAAEDRYNAALAKGVISEGEHRKAIDQVRATLLNQTNEIRKSEDANARMSKGVGLSAYAWQNLSYQVNDVVTSLASGISPFQTLAQQGGQIFQVLQGGNGGVSGALAAIKDRLLSISPAVGVFGLIAAGAIAAAAAVIQFTNAQAALRNALLGVGQTSGVTAGQVQEIAEASAKAASASVSSARDIAKEFLGTGNVLKEAFAPGIVAVENFSRATGTDISAAAQMAGKALSELGAGGLETLVSKSDKFDKQAVNTIKDLLATGHEAEAQALAIQKFGEAFTKARDNMTGLSSTWNSLTTGLGNIWDALGKKISGTGATMQEQLQRVSAAVDTRKAISAASGGGGNADEFDGELVRLQAEQKRLQAEIAKTEQAAKTGAQTARQNITQYEQKIVDVVVPSDKDVQQARQNVEKLKNSIGQAIDTGQSKQQINDLKEAMTANNRVIALATDAQGHQNAEMYKAKQILAARMDAERAVAPSDKAAAAAALVRATALGTLTGDTKLAADAGNAYKESLESQRISIDKSARAQDETVKSAVKVTLANRDLSVSSDGVVAANKAREDVQKGVIEASDEEGQRLRNLKQSQADIAQQISATTRARKIETDVQSGLNDKQAAGAITAAQAQAQMQGELQKRNLLIQIAGAEGESRKLLQQEYDNLTTSIDAQISAQSRQIALGVIENQNQEIKTLQLQMTLVAKTTGEREKALAVRRAEVDLIRQNIPATSTEGQMILKNAAAVAVATENLRKAEDQQEKIREGQKEIGSQFGTFIEELVLGTGKLSNALGGFAKSFASSGLKAILAGEGPLAGMLGTASNDPKQQGGLLGGILPNGFKDLIKQGTAEGSEKGTISGWGNLFDGGEKGAAALKGIAQGAAGVMSIAGSYSAGAQAHSKTQAMLSGAVSGGVGGMMLGMQIGGSAGPIGAAIGAAAGGLLSLLGFDNAQKQKIKEQKDAWIKEYKDALPQINVFRSQLRGEAQTGNATTIKQAYDQMVQIWEKAVHGGDNSAGIQIEAEFNQMQQRLFVNFQRGFEGTFAEMTKGLGTNGPFQQAEASVVQMGEGLKAFVQDAVYFKIGAEGVERAQHAAMDSALAMLDPAKEISNVESEMQRIAGTAAALQTVMQQLGAGAEDAARIIQDRVNVALANLRDTFDKGVQSKLFDAQDKGYLNDASDLIKEVGQMFSDAAAIGGNAGQVDTYFTAAAQKIVNESSLTGDAFNELVRMFPQLQGRVHEFSEALVDSAGDIAKAAEDLAARRAAYADRLFAAENPTDTLAAQLAEQDRKAAKDRAAEAKAGNGAIVELELALAAERRKIMVDYATAEREQQRKNAIDQLNVEKDAADAALAAANTAVDAARSALQASYDKQAGELNTTITRLDSFTKSIHAFRQSLLLDATLSPLSPEAKYLEAQRQFRATSALAATGDQTAQDNLQGASQAYLDASRDFYASSETYYRDFVEVQGILERTETKAQADLDIAKNQLASLNTMVGTLLQINTNTMPLAAAIANLAAAMGAQALAAQTAQAAQAAAAAAAAARPTVSSALDWGTPLDQAYQSLLGRHPDEAGAAYFAGQSAAQIQAGIMATPEYKALHGYVNGGVVGNGVWNKDSVLAAFAGGGNIALAGGEFVMPAPQTAQFMPTLEAMRSGRPTNDNSTRDAMRALITEVRQLRSVTAAAAVQTGEKLDRANAAATETTTALKRVVAR